MKPRGRLGNGASLGAGFYGDAAGLGDFFGGLRVHRAHRVFGVYRVFEVLGFLGV